MGKILFIRGGAIGDFILTLPAIQLARENLPENEIEILGYPSIAGLALSCGIADRVRSLEDGALAPFFAPGAKLDPAMAEYLASFDLVVNYLYDPDGFFEGNLAAAGAGTVLSGPFRPEETRDGHSPVPAALQLAKPLESVGLFLEDPAPVFSYPEPPEDLLSVAADGAEGKSWPRLLVALHPGSGSPAKNWSFEAWVAVARELRESWPEVEFAVTSGEAESETIEDFLGLMRGAGLVVHHLAFRDLGELAGLFARCDLYLGHDSGLSHLAASAGARGVLLFGPTEPGVWAPSHSRMKVLRSSTRRLSDLTVAEVLDAAQSATSPQG